jgi:hypothetical protein
MRRRRTCERNSTLPQRRCSSSIYRCRSRTLEGIILNCRLTCAERVRERASVHTLQPRHDIANARHAASSHDHSLCTHSSASGFSRVYHELGSWSWATQVFSLCAGWCVCQNFCSHRQGGAHRDGTTTEYFWHQLEHLVVPNVQRLQAMCRKFRVEVIFTVSRWTPPPRASRVRVSCQRLECTEMKGTASLPANL